MPLLPTARVLLAVVAMACVDPAWAKSSDRNQPMDIDAGRQQGSFESNSTNTLSGGVHITQGSLDIRSGVAVITLAGGEPSRAVFTGSPVVLKQQMDDGTPMTAQANKVDYNLKTEVVVFTGNVEIVQPRGTMSGQRVVYNLSTGRVDSGGEGNGRVKMRIMPKNAQQQPAQPSQAEPEQSPPQPRDAP